jgi:hypothetical protein
VKLNLDALEEIYWRWMEGPWRVCKTCGKHYRERGIRGMCEHAYADYQKRQGAKDPA